MKKVKTMKLRKGEIEPALLFVLAVIGLVAVLVLGAWIVPTYNVWAAGKAGEATLMRAEQEKQIQIEQAKAELESAKLRAQAIETIGEMAKKYPEYREQEFIAAFGEAIQSGEIDQIIYVPTEANIPITESRRMSRGE